MSQYTECGADTARDWTQNGSACS